MRARPSIFLMLAAFFSPLQAGITVSTDFPGGSGEVRSLDHEQQRLVLEPSAHLDRNRGWRCWWYVKLRGLDPAMPLTLEVGEAPWATPLRATYSVDGGRTWQHSAPGNPNGKRMSYRLDPGSETVAIAWGPPFVAANTAALLATADHHPDVEAFVLCKSRDGHDTHALRVTNLTNRASPRPLLWIQARQHAWESGSSWVAHGFITWLLSDHPGAARMRQNYETVIVPIMDIDNVQRGAGGKNQEPQDHNRDWSDQPHWHAVIAAQKHLRAAAEARRLALFIDLHNPGARDLDPYFYVPPDQILSNQARVNLARFLDAARNQITGPLRFRGRTIPSGPKYDPKGWKGISKNWVASLWTPAPALTLETPWNTPASTVSGYQQVGRELGHTLAHYFEGP